MAEQNSDLLICVACGTQFATKSRAELRSCRTCDDPRQYVPRTGQTFTTLAQLRDSNKYNNEFSKVDEQDDRFWAIRTVPALAINQRAILIKTPRGNVLWDCITYIDDKTVKWVNDQGGLHAIVISHPHYYSTHLEWANAFRCAVYLANEDKEWLNRTDSRAQVFLGQKITNLEIKGERTGIEILKLGGHFPGSLVLLAYKRLLIADTLMTTPAGLGDWSKVPGPSDTVSDQSSPIPFPLSIENPSQEATIQHRIGERPQGLNSYSFMWSIPNMIPLNPGEIVAMWDLLKGADFTSTHGAFTGMDVYDEAGGSQRSVKGRILDSMQIQVRRMGWYKHDILSLQV